MITSLHNRPEMMRIGPWVFATYGPAMALTFFMGFAAAVGFDAYTGQDPVVKLRFYLFVVFPMILLGCRAASVLLEWGELFRDPIRTLFKPGFMLQGGIFGGCLALTLYSVWSDVDLLRLTDAGAFAMPLGESLGRVGCHLYGCCWGRKTTSKFIAVVYESPSAKVSRCRPDLRGERLHPTPLYATVLYGAVFIAFVVALPYIKHAGVLTAAYLIVHPILRFILEKFRDDDRGTLAGGWTHSNLYSALMMIGGVVALVLVYTGHAASLWSTPTPPFDSIGAAVSSVLDKSEIVLHLCALSLGAFCAFGIHYRHIGAWLGTHQPLVPTGGTAADSKSQAQ